MSMQEKRRRILEDLQVLPDRFERFTWLVDIGRAREPLPESFRTDVFRVEGCQSMLWLVPELRHGRCYFRADSDSAVVKGIASLICDYYSGELPQDILAGSTDFLREAGIDQHLSSNRRNGLGRVDERIKRFARSCLAQEPA